MNPLIPSHTIFFKFILVQSSHLRLGLPSDLFPLGFLSRILYALIFQEYMPCPHPRSFVITSILFDEE
jgi:hypothetical protein